MVERLRIDRLGHRGDGVADLAEGAVFVNGALPGEEVEVDRAGERATLLRVIAAAPERVAPYCPEVGACGGCVTQHLAQDAALAWKRQLLIDAFAREGFDVADRTAATVDAHGAGRRRATLHARADGAGRMVVGFSMARSHQLHPVPACPLFAPGLGGAIGAARGVAAALAGKRKPLDIAATASDAGLDMDVRGGGPPSEGLRLELVRRAEAFDLARLSIHGDVVVERRKPVVAMGRAQVVLPPGSFLQATRAGEEILGGIVLEAVGSARRIADLFCGVGPFALRLAENAEVYAADSDARAVTALDVAARATPKLKRVRAEARDLFRRPLLASELKGFGAVTFDPPRAGAEAQARMLATSQVPLVIAVSCNAGTLARDAAILIRGGYRLRALTPVDQFRHSAHVEAVAVFERG